MYFVSLYTYTLQTFFSRVKLQLICWFFFVCLYLFQWLMRSWNVVYCCTFPRTMYISLVNKRNFLNNLLWEYLGIVWIFFHMGHNTIHPRVFQILNILWRWFLVSSQISKVVAIRPSRLLHIYYIVHLKNHKNMYFSK